ncbi:type II toxin-antitoxin system VapC family toxin [Geodermatophilus sp. DSM 44513]|uniref:type II toxin-antitoxin system VapC family toxin n=1 Tax=Geodermatophilus sp. DSM 44513 TaxID=1528104 RepID=UPI001286F358|nr:type II toxin-antitoxin system VapC family toxin [Geodermatophilus sp. DSM 44513]WNV76867.1 type II toxin-antitoxin system VapC family toxin [Geodermatophilus sp. DSM 44513]
MRAYADTSALAKLLKDEDGSAALQRWLVAEEPELVSSVLVRTELHRVGLAYGVPRPDVAALLREVDLLRLTDAVLEQAERVPAAPGRTLGALDAIHLASAQRVGLTTMVVYDQQLADAAVHHGVTVVAPR